MVMLKVWQTSLIAKNSRELSKVHIEKITKEENADLRRDLFDFCIFGETIEEILGNKFPNPE